MMDGYRYAAKTLARNRLFTSAVVLTLAVAISVSTVVVSATIRAEQSPAVPGATRLRTFYTVDLEDGRLGFLSYREYVQFRDLSTDTMTVAAFGTGLELTALLDHAVQVGVSPVSGNYFTVLGARPTLGRLLTSNDDIAGAAPVAVLTDHAWATFFGGNPDIVGQTVRIRSVAYTVVGVAPNPLAGPTYDPDIWVPFSQTAQLLSRDGVDVLKTDRSLRTIGRLRADRDVQQLDALLDVATARLRRAGLDNPRRGAWSLDAQALNRVSLSPASRDARMRLLVVLTLLTGGFLVAACSNITLLMVTRSTERAHELAVRSAIGATTVHLVRLYAWEIGILVALGSTVAVVALPWMGRLLAMPQLEGLVLTAALDPYAVATVVVIAVSVGAAILGATTLGIAARSRWQGLRLLPGTRVTRRATLRQFLVVAQVTLAYVLLMAAGLLAQTARSVASLPRGFVPDVLVARLIMPPDRYAPPDGMALYERLRASLVDHPLLSAVGLAWRAPLSQMTLHVFFEVPGSANPERATPGNFVSPGYFRTVGVPVLDGRAFLSSDDPNAPLVVIVNRAFAERWWPDRDAVGRELILPLSGGRRRVVGVVDNLRYRALTEPVQPLVYLPLTQRYQPWVFLHVRSTTADPMRALPTLRSIVADIDPQIGIGEPRTLEDDIQASLAEWRGPASLAGLLAVVTVLLATGGLYATLASSVSQRTKEMSIRRALGAQDGQVRRLVMGQGLRVATVGIVLGVGATAVVMGYLESLLYGVTSGDVLTQVVVVALLGVVAYVSSWGPARRAAHVDPMMALRAE